jgi:protein ImuB
MRSAERVVAVWSPDWPVTAAMQAAHVPPHRPAAVFLANRVVACSAGARTSGVKRGLRRREAQARCPEIAVLTPDPERDARLFEPVVLAVEELAPGVEVVRPGLLVLPAKGPVGFFGGERGTAERIVDQVAARTGVECQVGFADGLFAAVLAARRGVGIEPGRSAEFLAPLGVEELDRESDVDRAELVDLLRRLGLRSLGAFGALAAADVASRFGADAVLAHRLARGLDPRPPVRRRPPEELAVEIELDPPVDRVDAAAFAARALAEQLHRTLAGHGLSCTRLGVWARTEQGEELLRVWRCAEPLSPSGTVDRLRWQLDAWLTRGGSGAVVALRLTPEETVTAGALQLGLWGDVGESDERAGRALARVQALLGPESVVTAVLTGGRDPGDRVRLVPWGDDREPGSGAPGAPTGPPAPPPSPGYGPYPDQAGAGFTTASRAAAQASSSAEVGTAPALAEARAAPALRIVRPDEREDPGCPGADRHAATDGPDRAGRGDRAGRAEGAERAERADRAERGGQRRPAPPRPLDREPSRGFAPNAPAAALRGNGPTDRPLSTGTPAGARRQNRSRPITSTPAAREPVPAWPGRLPAPSPTSVPEEPLPVELWDAADAPVVLREPDLLSAPPHRLLLPPHPPREIRGWAGPWPSVERWWSPDGTAAARLQVELADGAALLLRYAGGGWSVTGIY